MTPEVVFGLVGTLLGVMVTLSLAAVSAAKAWGRNITELESMRRELEGMRTTASNTLARVGNLESWRFAVELTTKEVRRAKRDMAAEQSRGIPAPVTDDDSEP